MNFILNIPENLVADMNAIIYNAENNVSQLTERLGRSKLDIIENLLAHGIIIYQQATNGYALTNIGLLFKKSKEVNWITMTSFHEVPEHLEMIFHTRFGKTVIGTLIGNQVRCGNQNIPIEDITHYRKQLDKPQAV